MVGRSDDARNFSGLWQCAPGVFEVTYPWYETFYVLEGLVSIEGEDGEVSQFKNEDVVHFPIGLESISQMNDLISKSK